MMAPKDDHLSGNTTWAYMKQTLLDTDHRSTLTGAAAAESVPKYQEPTPLFSQEHVTEAHPGLFMFTWHWGDTC